MTDWTKECPNCGAEPQATTLVDAVHGTEHNEMFCTECGYAYDPADLCECGAEDELDNAGRCPVCSNME